MATVKKRAHLSIDKKFEVIKYAADHPGVGVRAIGEQFKIGKTQVSDILKNKDSFYPNGFWVKSGNPPKAS